MAYRFRVYLPASGFASANVYMGNTYQTTIYGDGSTSAKYDRSGITTSMTVRDVTLASGYVFSRWVINIDGSTTYSYSERLDISYSSSYSNVQVRAEVEQVTTYYATINYNANGGSGAPSSQSKSSTSQFITFDVPGTTPTRSGYSFRYWLLENDPYYDPTYPNSTITVGGNTGSYAQWTLYAVWQETSNAGAYIHNGSQWQHYTPYIHNGSSWQKYDPHVYSGGW